MRGWALLIAWTLALLAEGQQIAQYTQYVFNHFSVNPAVAGSKDCMDVRLGYRQQWVGFEGAPTTAWASIHGTLKPKGKPYQANKHGIGAFVEADDTGPLGYTHFYLAYAYHLQVSRGYYLSAGVFGGVKQLKLDQGQVTLENYDDPAIAEAAGSVVVYPEVAPGLWAYGNTFWAGVAAFGLLNNQVDGIGVETRATSRHLKLSGGYRVRIGRHTAFTPSTLIRVSPGSPVGFDLNAMVDWKRKYGIGVSYRNQDAVAFMGKVSFLKYFSLGYSYDITTSPLRVSSSNTHEVILAITPCPPVDPSKRIVSCPIFE
ncbi:MAG: type IX secretion system membrane protein PorP/SprF [Flavobacteriales bacterium]|nr:type IX secretion system membrane protein PorP/SprF [Flavobacteriales bacterium]